MSEFKKELEKNMELRKIAYKREDIDSDFFVAKLGIERIFHDWQPPKELVVVPEITQKQADTLRDYKSGSNSLLEYLRVEVKKKDYNRFARAWLDGYTVEKEKKFSLVNKITGEYLVLPAIEYRIKNENIFDHSVHCKNDDLSEWKPEMYQFTKVEIASMETGSYEQIPVEMSDNGI